MCPERSFQGRQGVSNPIFVPILITSNGAVKAKLWLEESVALPGAPNEKAQVWSFRPNVYKKHDFLFVGRARNLG
jgi:hypothetical protein